MTVEELIHKLMDCRPDADVFTTYDDETSTLDEVHLFVNCGNHVKLCNRLGYKSFLKARKEGK